MNTAKFVKRNRLRARRAHARWTARTARRTVRPGALPQALCLPPVDADPWRLVPAPVFVLSSIRSGSTLLRVVLNSHSQICAPHEMHLRRVHVDLSAPNAAAGVAALGLNKQDMEDLLWDRMLHLQLALTGKSVIVDKTPQNVFDWQRLTLAWPQARYLFLLRHPVDVYDSMRRAWKTEPATKHYEVTTRYARVLAEARTRLPGLTVRYEEFTADPVHGSQQICAWLAVPWEESMLQYAKHDHGDFRGRLGDWSEAIRSGVIRPPRAEPRVVPDELREACDLLGYS